MGISAKNVIERGPEPDGLADMAKRLATRLATLRHQSGLSLDDLATQSGISRATLSRLEHGETSPTAVLLGRLCAAYGRTMSSLLAEVEDEPSKLLRRDDQPVWDDPETGFQRRSLSPPAPGFRTELVKGELPAGADIAYAASPIPDLEHHLVMLGGALELTVEGDIYRLTQGDCLRYRLLGHSRYFAPGPDAAVYVIAITKP
jgi:transcriptional regulator with XRE-family HTH domain